MSTVNWELVLRHSGTEPTCMMRGHDASLLGWRSAASRHLMNNCRTMLVYKGTSMTNISTMPIKRSSPAAGNLPSCVPDECHHLSFQRLSFAPPCHILVLPVLWFPAVQLSHTVHINFSLCRAFSGDIILPSALLHNCKRMQDREKPYCNLPTCRPQQHRVGTPSPGPAGPACSATRMPPPHSPPAA